MFDSLAVALDIWQLTTIVATFVCGFVLYILWKKSNNRNPNVVIQSLHIYPIKSCKGLEVNHWPLSKYGLKYDREWMIYNPKTKRFLTQRQIPSLALIQVELDTNNEDINDINGITLIAPHMTSIMVQIQRNESNENKVEGITLWNDKVSGSDQGDQIAMWLTKYINNGKQYRLLRISSTDYKRATNPKYTPMHLRGSSQATYADGYPYLIASQSSLDSVNQRLEKRGFNRIAMNRFRPNIVIRTDANEPFIEDRIATLTLEKEDSSITLYVTHPCARCQMPTINQESGVKNKTHEPTLTLRTFRSGKKLGFDQDEHEEVFFGMNAVHDTFDSSMLMCKGDVFLPVFK